MWAKGGNMRKSAIKHVLFSLLGLASLPAFAEVAEEKDDLILVEELPVDIRVAVHRKVKDYLQKNPQVLDEAAIVALDQKGTIYVLDKYKSKIGDAGQPSCMSGTGKVIEEFAQEN